MDLKNVLKAIAFAFLATAISIVAIAVALDTPIKDQLNEGTFGMFIVGLFVFLLSPKKTSN